MKIAIVHESEAAAGVLGHAVAVLPGCTTAWTATTAESALEHCRKVRPDVLLLQASLRGDDPVGLTQRIMRETPCAIVLLTDQTATESGRVFDAMGAGAIDVVTSPHLDRDGRLVGVEDVVRKVRLAGTLTGSLKERGRSAPQGHPAGGQQAVPPLVAIGASTGGPAAIARVLSPLEAGFCAAILVVQHVGAEFTGDLATWLAGQVRLPVRVAARGERPPAGVVLIAGSNDDLVITPARAVAYRRPAGDSFYHPSVDEFFNSLAAHWPDPGLAVLLTGIGRDGAAGLLSLRRAGWTTIAQDQASSVVYGMPKAAAELKAASLVLPLDRIGAVVASFGTTPRKTRREPGE